MGSVRGMLGSPGVLGEGRGRAGEQRAESGGGGGPIPAHLLFLRCTGHLTSPMGDPFLGFRQHCPRGLLKCKFSSKEWMLVSLTFPGPGVERLEGLAERVGRLTQGQTPRST